MKARRNLSLTVLILVFGSLFLASCTDNNPAGPPATSPLIGTWLLKNVNGQDMSWIAGSMELTTDKLTTRSIDACEGTYSYVVKGDTLIRTALQDDPCDEMLKGQKDTATYKLTGDELKITSLDGSYGVFKKAASGTALDLVGYWEVVTVNGQNASALGATWKITNDQAIYQQGSTNCTAIFSYTAGGNKINTTVVQDGCTGDPVGAKETMSYTIAGSTLTFTGSGTTMVLKRTTDQAVALTGRWSVVRVNGQPIPDGNSMTLDFTASNLKVTRNVDGFGTCESTMSLSRNGDHITSTVVSTDCEGLNIGDVDDVHASIMDGTLTLVFSDNTTLEAVRN